MPRPGVPGPGSAPSAPLALVRVAGDPAPVLGWQRKIVRRRWTYAKRAGRPALPQDAVELICRPAAGLVCSAHVQFVHPTKGARSTKPLVDWARVAVPTQRPALGSGISLVVAPLRRRRNVPRSIKLALVERKS